MVMFAIVITKTLRVWSVLVGAELSASYCFSIDVEDQKSLALSKVLRNGNSVDCCHCYLHIDLQSCKLTSP